MILAVFATTLHSTNGGDVGDVCESDQDCNPGLVCSAAGTCIAQEMEEIVVTARRITVIRLPLFGSGPRILGDYSLFTNYFGPSVDMYPGYGTPHFVPSVYDSDADGVIDCIDDLTATITPAPISSSMGWRTINGQREYHGGTDIDVPNGTPLRAAQAGVVYEVEDGMRENTFSYENPNGNFVRVNNADGSQTVIIHMLSVEVSIGDVVLPGDIVGASNNTGRSFKPHAHVQIWRDKNWKRLGLRKEASNLYDPEVRYGC